MPASCIFAAAPRQAGASRGSGHRSKDGAQVKGALSEGEKRGDSQGRDGRRDCRPRRQVSSCARAAAQNGGTKWRHEKQGRPKRWGGSGEGRGKKNPSPLRARRIFQSRFIAERKPALEYSGSSVLSPPRYILGCSPQSERSHRSAIPGPGIRELTALEEGS